MSFNTPASGHSGEAGPARLSANAADTARPDYFSRAERRDWRNRRFLRKGRAHDTRGV